MNELDEETLKEFGVTVWGDRKSLLKAIKEYSPKSVVSPVVPVSSPVTSPGPSTVTDSPRGGRAGSAPTKPNVPLPANPSNSSPQVSSNNLWTFKSKPLPSTPPVELTEDKKAQEKQRNDDRRKREKEEKAKEENYIKAGMGRTEMEKVKEKVNRIN